LKVGPFTYGAVLGDKGCRRRVFHHRWWEAGRVRGGRGGAMTLTPSRGLYTQALPLILRPALPWNIGSREATDERVRVVRHRSVPLPRLRVTALLAGTSGTTNST